MQGLYRSELICPTCQHRSVKFDPFTYLTLQLPSSKSRSLAIKVITVDGTQLPRQYAVSVPVTGKACLAGERCQQRVSSVASHLSCSSCPVQGERLGQHSS